MAIELNLVNVHLDKGLNHVLLIVYCLFCRCLHNDCIMIDKFDDLMTDDQLNTNLLLNVLTIMIRITKKYAIISQVE
ncbi:unnamed protein product [Schistosoma margrebowiei]|uniref:Uncharacterized protein n=1 Tax=Schistosoma margrebowiei TaxID=48269 RepID=A0A3P8DKZ0_9TREM|nr:unnamed protein product [Schistosoma margrebowiei]